MNLTHKYRFDFGGWLKQNAGNIGSVAGAAIGTVIAPGIGTSIGASLGGQVGNMAGTVGDGKVNQDTLRQQQVRSNAEAQLREQQGLGQLPDNSLIQNNVKQQYKNGGQMGYYNNNGQYVEGSNYKHGAADKLRKGKVGGFNIELPKGNNYNGINPTDLKTISQKHQVDSDSKLKPSGLTLADEFKELTGESWSKSVSGWRDTYARLNGKKLSTTAQDNLELIRWIKANKNKPVENTESDMSDMNYQAPTEAQDEDNPNDETAMGEGPSIARQPSGYQVGNRVYRQGEGENLDIQRRNGEFTDTNSLRGTIRNIGSGNGMPNSAVPGELQKQGTPVYANGGELNWLDKASRYRKTNELLNMSDNPNEDAEMLHGMSDDELHQFHRYCHGGKMR